MRKYTPLLIFFVSVFLIFFSNLSSSSQESELEKAEALNRKVLELLDQSKYFEVIQVAEEELAIWEKILGTDNWYVANKLNDLAGFYEYFGDSTKAEALYKRALLINEKVFGPDHPGVTTSIIHLAVYYKEAGEYVVAEELFRRALEIKEKAFGLQHPDLTLTLNYLADLYVLICDYEKAERLLKRSLEIKQKAFGPDDLKVASSVEDLAALYEELGNYTKAEALYRRALEIGEKNLGPDDPDLVMNIKSLAGFYFGQQDNARAEALYKRALQIKEKAFGPDHPNVVSSLADLVRHYEIRGEYSKAEPLLMRSLEIHKKAFGLDNLKVAGSLDSLAGCYCELGNYSKAEALYKRALKIREKVIGPDDPEIAWSWLSMAILYHDVGDYSRAEAFYKLAIECQEKFYGQDNKIIAITLESLANFYRSLSDYAKAEPLYKRALGIWENSEGPYSKFAAISMTDLAIFYAEKGDFRKAYNLLMKVQLINNKLIDQAMGFTSEQQKIKFISKKMKSLSTFFSLINQHLSQSSSAKSDALNLWFKRKGLILEAQRRFQEALVYSDDPQAFKTFQELSRVRAQLSRVVFSGPGKAGPDAYKKRIADLEAQKEKLEANLSRLCQAFVLKKKIAKADCEKVAGALPANTALIEFARVEMFNFKARGKEEKWLPAHYLAFVLHAGKGDRVGMIDLGGAEKIDKAVAKLKKEISVMDEKSIKSSRKIYELVFEPLRKDLGDVKEIFISPDGNLNLIPFEVLQGPDGRYLIEDYTFNYLSAGRDVLGFGQIKEQGTKALLMGDPAFDIGEEEKGSTLRKLALRKSKAEDIARRSTDMRGFGFKRLPGTREEVKAIQGLLGENKAELYIGKEALEEVLMQRKTPSIVHLATHGFFLSDLDLSEVRGDTFSRGMQQMIMFPRAKGKPIKIKNPLLRSGIALAGANNALKSGDTEKSDGIVTAEKILGLRLRGTDMVVLSACETGVGEVKTGEGVFGLRRAFTQAGAKSLVMSMWSVPDKETKELMVEFYRNILSGKMNRCQALRQAALKEMRIVKERHGHAYPLCWGGFVLIGEP